MEIFSSLAEGEHEQVAFWSDKVVRLRSIIAIHDTTLGPAIGGVRMFPYKSEEEALKDVLLLSKSMTYKAAAAGINLGGGQGVIIGDPNKDKNELVLRSFGRFVESLNGRYITAEDAGTTVEDMEIVRYETKYVTGLSRALGGGGEFNLADMLFKERCKLFVADPDPKKTEEAKERFNAEIISSEEIYDVEADIFSPNALGGIINDQTIERLKVKIVAGAANNQLEDDRHGDVLHAKKILYAPDFVIGAGGLINVVNELKGYHRNRAIQQARGIYDLLSKVLDKSEKENIPTYKAANLLAEERINQVKKFKQRHE